MSYFKCCTTSQKLIIALALYTYSCVVIVLGHRNMTEMFLFILKLKNYRRLTLSISVNETFVRLWLLHFCISATYI